MSIRMIQHINIRCADAARSRDFYVAAMGLTDGPRPPFRSQGFWMYAGETPIVHLVQKPEGEGPRGDHTGELDHIGLEAYDLEATRARLIEAGVAYRETVVPRDGAVQIFVTDPDGVKLELNFAPA